MLVVSCFGFFFSPRVKWIQDKIKKKTKIRTTKRCNFYNVADLWGSRRMSLEILKIERQVNFLFKVYQLDNLD